MSSFEQAFNPGLALPAMVDDPGPVRSARLRERRTWTPTYDAFGQEHAPTEETRWIYCQSSPRLPQAPKGIRVFVLPTEGWSLKGLAGIQQDGHWPFIHQFDPHHFLKAAGFTAHARGLDAPYKIFI